MIQYHGVSLNFGRYNSLAGILILRFKPAVCLWAREILSPLKECFENFPIPQGLPLLFLQGFPQEGSDLAHEMDAIL